MKRTKPQLVQLNLLPQPKILVKLTELEISRKILIIGHRLAPIQSPDTYPWELLIQSKPGGTLKATTAALALKDIAIFYNLFGNELLVPMLLLQDESNTNLLTRNKKSNSNVIIRAQVFDMGTYYDEQGLGAGDYLEFQCLDDQAKRFSFRPVKAQDIQVDERTAFFAALDAVIEQAIQQVKTPQDPITMIRTIFQIACHKGDLGTYQTVCEKPAASFSEYYSTSGKLQIAMVAGQSYMWKKGVDIRPLLPKELEPNPSDSRNLHELDKAFETMGLSLSTDEVEAFVRDELYHGRSVDTALQRCFTGLESVGYPESMIRDIYAKTKTFAEGIAKNWHKEQEPKEVATLRTRVLVIYERFLKWIRDIEAFVESEKDLNQPNFYTLTQTMNTVCGLIPILNDAIHNPLILKDLTPLIGELKTIEKIVDQLMFMVALDLKAQNINKKGVLIELKKPQKTNEPSKNKRKTKSRPPSKQNYVLKVFLADIEPIIYRKILIPGNRTLHEVSKIILAAMGWWDAHMHSFKIRDQSYGIPSAEDWEPVIDERQVRLDDLQLRKRNKLYYEYDFGDSWEHIIEVMEIQQADPDHEATPTVLDGKRACPPEDSGGVPGYYRILDTLAIPENQRTPDDQEFIEWLPPDYDPEAFDLKTANARLKKM